MSTTALQVPAHVAARIAARRQGQQQGPSLLSAVLTGDGFNFPKISTRASRFRLVEDGVETVVGINLDVIIVGVNPKVSKIFYSKPFDGAEAVRPDCFSNDGVTPDASVESPIHSNCASCPHNILGSKVTPTGAKSKMCGDQRHLAVVPAADPNKVYALTIPVSGMKGLREYFKELQNFDAEPFDVVTRLGFDEQVSYPKITFERKGFVPEKATDRVDAIVASSEVQEVIRVAPPTGRALAAPAAAPALAAPAPVVDEAYEEEAPPAKAASAKAPKDKPKTEPVKPSSELESKLDSLFAE